MNKHLQFIIEKADTSEPEYRAIKQGLIELDEIFGNSIIVSSDLVYSDLYHTAQDKLSDDVYNQLAPNGMSLEGFKPRGGDFTLTFWLYMTTLIIDQKPILPYEWEHFGEAMARYIFDLDTYLIGIYGDRTQRDVFPIYRIFNDMPILTLQDTQQFFSEFFKCTGFLTYQVRLFGTSKSLSFKDIMTKMRIVSSMRPEVWLSMAKSMKYLQYIMDINDATMPGSIKGMFERALWTQNREDGLQLIDSLINSAISMLREDDFGEDYNAETIVQGTVMHFLKVDPGLNSVIEAQIDPTNISLPLGSDLGLKLLLLTSKTLSEERPYYYEAYSVAYDIYDGNLEDDRDDYYQFLRELIKDLVPVFMAGYTGAIKEHNLILLP